MEFFAAYLRQRRREILALFLCAVLFAVSFRLYRLPLAAVGYPAFLCLLVLGVFAAFDIWRVWKNHERMQTLLGLTSAMITALPEAGSIGEEDCQALIRSLQEELKETENAYAVRCRGMVEYYTVWVHQIKTPITSMRLALEREDTPFSRGISSDLFQIEQYVEMVLAYLRLDSDSSDYVFREYDIDGIIRQSLARFSSEFINRRLRLDYTPVCRTVVTDEKWLSFVIDQVLSNALKYTREGGIRIYMRDPEILCIEDTGIGIAPSDLPRVFENGYTGCNGRQDKRRAGSACTYAAGSWKGSAQRSRSIPSRAAGPVCRSIFPSMILSQNDGDCEVCLRNKQSVSAYLRMEVTETAQHVCRNIYEQK